MLQLCFYIIIYDNKKAVVVMNMVECIELNGDLLNDMITPKPSWALFCNIAARSRPSKTPIEDRILI